MINIFENSNNVGEYSYLIVSRIRKDNKFREKLLSNLFEAYKKSLLTTDYVCVYTDGKQIKYVEQSNNTTHSDYQDWMRVTTFDGKSGQIDELDNSHYKQNARCFYAYIYNHFDEIDNIISVEVDAFMYHVEDCYEDYVKTHISYDE